MTEILSISDLSVSLPPGADRPFALDGVSIDLRRGEIHCLIGESGSGKSMIANAILGLLPDSVRVTAGDIRFEDISLLTLGEEDMRKIRGARIGMIFQEPMTALNPLRTIGDQIAEMFRTHTDLDKETIRARVLSLLSDVQIARPEEIDRAYPHELSGGQRQRAMIAMALALEPAILVADEPTTALDVTTQAQILALIRDLQARKGTSVLFITHDFGVVAEIADRVTVLQYGRVVEHGSRDQLLNHPSEPYTQELLAAVPSHLPPPSPSIVAEGEHILTISHVSKTYRRFGLLQRNRRTTQALNDVSVSLMKGTTLGIVGESGSGKSTLARCIVRLIDPDSGVIRLGTDDLTAMSRRDLRAQSRRIQMVFQDPYGSLNPRRTAGELVTQGLILHGMDRAQAWAEATEMFAVVGLDPKAIDRYPHEFSGGQRQRIGLARALALRPDVLVADEPVSALDVSVQAQILRLLANLRKTFGLSMIFITHDLRVAAQICDRVAVMKDGEVVEHGMTAKVFASPEHDYTKLLLRSIPGREWRPPIAGSEFAATAG
jgi:peptide/nickel transport system ATP-binding protein